MNCCLKIKNLMLFISLLFTVSGQAAEKDLQNLNPVNLQLQALPKIDESKSIHLKSADERCAQFVYPFHFNYPIGQEKKARSLNCHFAEQTTLDRPTLLVMGERLPLWQSSDPAPLSPMYSFVENFDALRIMNLSSIVFILVQKTNNPALPYNFLNITGTLQQMTGSNNIINLTTIAQLLATGDQATIQAYNQTLFPPAPPVYQTFEQATQENGHLKKLLFQTMQQLTETTQEKQQYALRADITEGMYKGQEIRHAQVVTKKDKKIDALTQILRISLTSQFDLFAQSFFHNFKSITKKLDTFNLRLEPIEEKLRLTQLEQQRKIKAQQDESATIIQNHVRQKLAQKEASKRKDAIVTLQKHARGSLARKEYRLLKERAAKKVAQKAKKERRKTREQNAKEIEAAEALLLVEAAQECQQERFIQIQKNQALIKEDPSRQKRAPLELSQIFIDLLLSTVGEEITPEEYEEVINHFANYFSYELKKSGDTKAYISLVNGYIKATDRDEPLNPQHLHILKVFGKLLNEHDIESFNDENLEAVIAQEIITPTLDYLETSLKRDAKQSNDVALNLYSLMIGLMKMHVSKKIEYKHQTVKLFQILKQLNILEAAPGLQNHVLQDAIVEQALKKNPIALIEKLSKGTEVNLEFKSKLLTVAYENFDHYLKDCKSPTDHQQIKDLIKLFSSNDPRKMELLIKYKEQTKVAATATATITAATAAAATDTELQTRKTLESVTTRTLEVNITKLLKNKLTLLSVQAIIEILQEIQKRENTEGKVRKACTAIVENFKNFKGVADIACMMNFATICPDDIYEKINK